LVCYVRADFFREQGSFHRKAVAAGDDEDGYEAGRRRHMGTSLFFHLCQRVSWVFAETFGQVVASGASRAAVSLRSHALGPSPLKSSYSYRNSRLTPR